MMLILYVSRRVARSARPWTCLAKTEHVDAAGAQVMFDLQDGLGRGLFRQYVLYIVQPARQKRVK